MKFLCLLLLSVHYLQAKEVLRHSHVIFRHGDRAPTNVFTDSKSKPNVWPLGLSQLTAIGMRQHFELGKWLRLRYKSLLRQPYNHEDISVRSTTVDRTLMSAESNLAGLYYDDSSKFIPGLNWRPVPVYTIPMISDTLILPPKCNLYRDRINEMYKNASFPSAFAKYQSTLDVMRKVSENPNLKFEDSWIIFDSLFCEKANNMTVGTWVNEELYQNISTIYALSWKMMYEGEEFGRLSGGRFLDLLVNEMKDFVTNEKKNMKPFQMISGHDQDIAALLSALGIYDGIRPPYAACLMFDLIYKPINDSNNMNNWVVKIYYKTKATDSVTDIPEMKISGCKSQPCVLSDFIEYLKPRTIDAESYEKMCSSSAPKNIYQNNFFGFSVILALVSLFKTVM